MCGRHEVLEDFNSWLGEQSHTHKVVISGNHDITLHEAFYEKNYWR
jgi:hypothetical protein